MSRTEWILGGILTILVLVIAGLLLLSWLQPEPETTVAEDLALQPVATSQFEGRSAKTAFSNALAAAAEWDESARLHQAMATWPPESDFSRGEASWSFTFFAPAQGRTALISVVEDEARFVSSRATTEEVVTMPADEWRTDSQAIVETFLANGGQDFLAAQQNVTLILTLSAGEPATWEAVMFSPVSNQSFNLKFNPSDGEIIQP